METSTAKGRGRPRKAAPVDNAVAEGENAHSNNDGNRETSGIQSVVQKDDGGKGKGFSFAELVEIVRQKNNHSHRISCVIHPDADGIISTDNYGNIRTEKGACGYQLNTGEIIELF